MGIAGLGMLKDDDGSPEEVNAIGWKHRMAGLSTDGTLYISEKVKKADQERLDKKYDEADTQGKRALEERERALHLGRKIG